MTPTETIQFTDKSLHTQCAASTECKECGSCHCSHVESAENGEIPMNRKEATVGVKKEKGYLYFVDKQGDIGRAKMARAGEKTTKGAAEKVARVGVKKDPSRLYFVDK